MFQYREYRSFNIQTEQSFISKNKPLDFITNRGPLRKPLFKLP